MKSAIYRKLSVMSLENTRSFMIGSKTSRISLSTGYETMINGGRLKGEINCVLLKVFTLVCNFRLGLNQKLFKIIRMDIRPKTHKYKGVIDFLITF